MAEDDDYIKGLSSYEWDKSLVLSNRIWDSIHNFSNSLKCYNYNYTHLKKGLGYTQRKYIRLILYYYWRYKRK